MPTIEGLSIQRFDELIADIKKRPFPEKATVRLTVTGLAFCVLKPDSSSINFLTHVENHICQMAIVRRVRKTNQFYPDRIYTITGGDTVEIEVAGSPLPAEIEGDGQYPLEEMVNIAKIHGDSSGPKKMRYIGPTNTAHPHYPSILTIHRAKFNTMDVHPELFVFEEKDNAGSDALPDEIGYILGGTIEEPLPSSGVPEVKITTGGKSNIPKEQVFKTEGVVYDIIFDNHCDPVNIKACNQKVVDEGGETGTDFFYYYDILREDGDVYRKLKLKHVNPPKKKIADTQEEEEPVSGSGEIAACNPIIVQPAPADWP